MGTINSVFSKFQLTQGVVQEIYACPAGKTHAYVDVNFFKDDNAASSLIAIAMSADPNPANLTSVDYFVDDIELIEMTNVSEISKVVVGQGERLYAVVMQGADVNARLTAMEENNPKVLKAGRLAAASISGVGQTQIFANALSNVAYISSSVTIFNTSATEEAVVEAWVTSSATPNASDKCLKITIPFQDTTILENLLLSPNEKIFVASSVPNAEYFVNGTIVSA